MQVGATQTVRGIFAAQTSQLSGRHFHGFGKRQRLFESGENVEGGFAVDHYKIRRGHLEIALPCPATAATFSRAFISLSRRQSPLRRRGPRKHRGKIWDAALCLQRGHDSRSL